jgi:hypothetical protein
MVKDVRFEGITPYLRYEDARAAIDWLVVATAESPFDLGAVDVR